MPLGASQGEVLQSHLVRTGDLDERTVGVLLHQFAEPVQARTGMADADGIGQRILAVRHKQHFAGIGIERCLD